MKSFDLPRKAIASLGHRVGAAKRRGHSYVSLPIEQADEIRKVLAHLSRMEYQKEYRKL